MNSLFGRVTLSHFNSGLALHILACIWIGNKSLFALLRMAAEKSQQWKLRSYLTLIQIPKIDQNYI